MRRELWYSMFDEQEAVIGGTNPRPARNRVNHPGEAHGNPLRGKKNFGIKEPLRHYRTASLATVGQRWANSVIHRDGYECQLCGSDQSLVAHHIKPRKEYPELKLDTENGITLCASCHVGHHKKRITR